MCTIGEMESGQPHPFRVISMTWKISSVSTEGDDKQQIIDQLLPGISQIPRSSRRFPEWPGRPGRSRPEIAWRPNSRAQPAGGCPPGSARNIARPPIGRRVILEMPQFALVQHHRCPWRRSRTRACRRRRILQLERVESRTPPVSATEEGWLTVVVSGLCADWIVLTDRRGRAGTAAQARWDDGVGHDLAGGGHVGASQGRPGCG